MDNEYIDQYTEAYREIKDEAPDGESFGYTVQHLTFDEVIEITDLD